eukprot:CAMPEP_0198215888 /NCGR_PEP_ID=MMETSP1445-20131203/53353_1 /TAXON_ID=36898 /ORGANISM="Pyramimonas sp., Strain CCMP2087" /LENGTH=57 /DNA_ID=CAMNT_0043891841 /DNA_START=161 /DNA_END=334 /DNA_ORIENTATION=+
MGASASVQRVGFKQPEPYYTHTTPEDEARKQAFEERRQAHYQGVGKPQNQPKPGDQK